jgi:hypothetical protein
MELTCSDEPIRRRMGAGSGAMSCALYLADTPTTATAEWYRSLAEWGLSPQDHIPYDHHRWRHDLELADLSPEM